MPRTARDIINASQELLDTAYFGLDLVKQRDPPKVKIGLGNIACFGRATTFALQNLRSISPEFDAWYSLKQAEMKNDPIATYFLNLRNRIEKGAGVIPQAVNFRMTNFDSSRDLSLFDPKPPNAVSMIIGDKNGGSGWLCRNKDGTEEMFYVSLPERIITTDVAFPFGPQLKNKPRPSAAEVAEAYLASLSAIVEEAREKFISV